MTTARSGEVRGATWGEMDLEGGVWTVGPERMKAEREHRVPLSKAALALLKRPTRAEDADIVFPAARAIHCPI